MVATSLDQPRVLVVDDSHVVLEVTKAALQSAGYQVITHDRPGGCVALILQESPDLVLIDVNMPRLGGDTVAKVFGTAHPNSTTIVLLFSSLPEEALRLKASASGAHGYIRKTDDLFDLVRQVNHWLKRRSPASAGKLRVAARATEGSGRPLPGRTASGTMNAAPKPDVPEARTSGTHPLDRPVVLLVDSDMRTLSEYRRELQSEQLSLEFALSGTQALTRIGSENPPRIVVASLNISDLTPEELYARATSLHANLRDRYVLIVPPRGAAESGAFVQRFPGSVLRSPIDGEDLRRAVRSYLAKVSDVREAVRR